MSTQQPHTGLNQLYMSRPFPAKYDDEIEFNGECLPKIKSSVIAKPFDLSIFGKN